MVTLLTAGILVFGHLVPLTFCQGTTASGLSYSAYIEAHATTPQHKQVWTEQVKRGQIHICGNSTL